KRRQIIDLRRNALSREFGFHPVAVGNLNRVLRPGGARALDDLRHADAIGAAELFGVATRDLFARFQLVRKDLELFNQDGGLDGVEPRIHADAHILVFVATLAVNADRAQQLGQRVVVRETAAAVAVAAERPCGEETRRCGIAYRRRLAAVERSA